MNLQELTLIFNADAASALSPLVAITAGLLLLLCLEILPNLLRFRPYVFVGTIVSAAWCQFSLLSQPVGEVMASSYVSSTASAVWGLIFLASALIAWTFSQRYYKTNRAFIGEHDVLMLASVLGMTLMAGSRDLITFFVGLELLSIPLYCLAAFRRSNDASVEAGLKYFVLGAFSSATFLYGTALLYTGTGTVSITALTEIAQAGGLDSSISLVGLALIMASLFFKAGVVPFHLWVPDVYQGSPTPVTALMATGTKAAAIAFMLQLLPIMPLGSAPILAGIAVLTMAVGNLGALMQEDLKRMLAYSGVAHAGAVLLAVAGGIAGDPENGATGAALYYLAAYVFTAGGAFGLISWLEADGERFTKIESIKGLAQRRPGIAAAMALFMLSLGGIPATGGFLGKWLVFSVAVRADMIGFAIAGILMSVVALGYYLRVVVAMYMQPAPEGLAPPMTRRLSAAVATGACAFMVLLLGVLPGLLLDRLL